MSDSEYLVLLSIDQAMWVLVILAFLRLVVSIYIAVMGEKRRF